MARPQSNLPTDGELELLRIVWAHPDSSITTIHKLLCEQRPLARGTVQTRLGIMVKKGLLQCKADVFPPLYRATQSETQAKRGMLRTFIDSVFNGSLADLLQHSHGDRASKAELKDIEKHLNQRKRTKGRQPGDDDVESSDQ